MKKKRLWKMAILVPLAALCLLAYPNLVTIRGQVVPAGSLTDSFDHLASQIQITDHHAEQIEDLLSSSVSSESPPESVKKPSTPIPSLTPEERDELDELIASYGKGVSVYYESLTRGDVYEYASDSEYYIASIVKAPYALYLYELADEGLCDLSQAYPYKSEYNQGDFRMLQQKSSENLLPPETCWKL